MIINIEREIMYLLLEDGMIIEKDDESLTLYGDAVEWHLVKELDLVFSDKIEGKKFNSKKQYPIRRALLSCLHSEAIEIDVDSIIK